MKNTARVLSLKARTLIFLISLLLLSAAGAFLMWNAQEKLLHASDSIRQNLVPTRRLIEHARAEVDLQIQELTLLTQSVGGAKGSPQDAGLLRLGPSVRALETLSEGPLLPAFLAPLLEGWKAEAKAYQAKAAAIPESRAPLGAALEALRSLRTRTQLLARAVDREFSVQLLSLSDTSRDYLVLWSSALGLAVLMILVFTSLLWRWTQPLEQARSWLDDDSTDPVRSMPPRSVTGEGLLAPPAEVQTLIEALRAHMHRFRMQSRELETRAEKITDSERAMGVLFSALQHLLRHNEELFEELLKKERLASMGEMAAQLAHEIRNPLNSLNLKLELLREDLGLAEQKQLDAVLGEIDRLDALTESHLRTTRARLSDAPGAASLAAPEPEINDLNQLVEQTVDFVGPDLASHRASVRLELSPKALPCRVPSNIVRAALLNLIKNAWEALGDAKEREIFIRSRAGAGTGWQLEILDRGRGFPPELVGAEPQSFFTTKKGGSGLGLVTSARMLAAYGVALRIESPEGDFRACVSLTKPDEAGQKVQAIAGESAKIALTEPPA